MPKAAEPSTPSLRRGRSGATWTRSARPPSSRSRLKRRPSASSPTASGPTPGPRSAADLLTLTRKERRMAKEELVEFDGLVTELLPEGRFRVKLENDHEILA